jgi:hypothetical protein
MSEKIIIFWIVICIGRKLKESKVIRNEEG